MLTVNIHDAKAQLSKLIDRAAKGVAHDTRLSAIFLARVLIQRKVLIFCMFRFPHGFDRALRATASRYLVRSTLAIVMTIQKTLKQIGNKLQEKWSRQTSLQIRDSDLGIFEFRGMGGAGYQNNFEAIRKQIVNMSNILKLGSDDTVMVKEYISKVFLLLSSGKYSNPQIGSGQIVVPTDLSSFQSIFLVRPDLLDYAKDQPLQFLKSLLRQVEKKEIPTLDKRQIIQIRVFVTRHKWEAKQLYIIFQDIDIYNVIAKIMRWKISTNTEWEFDNF